MDDPASYFLFFLSQDTTVAPVSNSISTILLKIASVFLLVAANGFFVAAEFAFVGVRRSRIETLAASGNKSAKRVLNVLDNMSSYLSAAQLGITLASLGLGWLGEPALSYLLERPLSVLPEATRHLVSFAIAFTIISSLHIIFGEQAPKLIGIEKAERTSLMCALPMQIFHWVFQYPIRALDWACVGAAKLLGAKATTEHASIYTEEEIRQLINISHKSGHLGQEEQRLINRVFEFSETLVREAMVPRTQMSAIPDTSSLEEIAKAFEKYQFSRLPVYRETLDDVIGFIHSKDVMPFLLHPEKFALKEVLQDPVYVVDTARLEDVLRQLQKAKAHFAFVVDEHGGVEGILTLEDLLEEIVGEISDEHDEEVNEQITAEKDGTYILEGGLAVRDLNRRLSLNLPESASYTTIAGFLMSEAGQVPKAGEQVKYDNLVFQIERVEKRRIVKVRLEKIEQEEPSEQEAVTRTAAN
jgi:CBS domain containing-hemolysin-like protein